MRPRPSKPPQDPIVAGELPLIRKIVEDETWLEGERRGCPVSPHDPVVHENVCKVILRVGEKMRENLTASLNAQRKPVALRPDMPPSFCD
jgi:hypothetical protein